MPDGYDSEEDSSSTHLGDADSMHRTPAGLVPIDYGGETDDHGEEAYYRAKMLNRALRRMERWEENKAVVRTKPKGSSRALENGSSGRINDDEFGDEDEEMQDADDGLERRDDSEAEDEDEDERMYDGRPLPPLPEIMG